MKYCPYCNSRLVGKQGEKVCSNLACRAYQVDTLDPESYDRPLSKKGYERRKDCLVRRTKWE